MSTQNVASDHEKELSDQDDRLEGEYSGSEWDPADIQAQALAQAAAQARPQSQRSVRPDQSQRSDQVQSLVQDQPVSQAHFPVLAPQGQGQGRPVVVRHDDLDSLFNEENFSLDLIRR